MIGLHQTLNTTPSVYTGAFSYTKALILGFLATACGFLFGFLASNAALSGFLIEGKSVLFLAACTVLLLIFLIFEFIFISKKNLLSLLLLVNWVGIFAGVFLGYRNLTQNLLYGFLASVIFIILGDLSVRSKIDDSLKFSFFKVSNYSLKFSIAALAIIASVLFLDVFLKKPLDKNNFLFSEKLFETTLVAFSKSFSFVFGEVDFTKTLKEAAWDMIDFQVNKNNSSLNFSDSQKEVIVNNTINSFQSWIESFFGRKVDVNKKLSSELYFSFFSKISSLSSKAQKMIIVLESAFILFSILIVSPIVRIIISLLAFVFYEILIVLNFGAVVYENRSKEVVVLP
jgi:hypothetical protein